MPISWTPRAPPTGWACVAGFRILSSSLSSACSSQTRSSQRPRCDASSVPLLADERFGGELIETLQAYFDASENVTAAARRLNLATRTVAYRLEKIESLLGHPLDGDHGRRLSTALMVQRLRSVD